MRRRVTATVFVAMAREEWRLHAALFGGRRFGAFPAFVAVAGAGAVWLLLWTGSTPGAIARWIHWLVLAFGLYTGSAGLVGRDAIRDLLGDVTLVVFSARTLPVGERHLLGVFLAKDIVYYAALFLVPLTVAYAPAASAADTLLRLPIFWLTLSATFVVGLVGTVAVISARTRGRAGTASVLLGAVALGLAWAAGVDLAELLPAAVYLDGLTVGPLAALTVTAVVAVAAVLAFDPTRDRPVRTTTPQYSRWRRRLPNDPDGLLAKTLLDVARSSGGVWKVVFSGGVLFAVTALLVELAGTITGRPPSTGLSFGAVLGLSAFTTYNWVTQFDDLAAYRAYPLSTAAVFRAKFHAFVVLGLPTAAAYYLLAVGYWGERLSVAVTGLVILFGLAVYLFGLTVALAGLEPNAFLFDTVRFAAFAVGAAVPLVPVLVVAFAVVPTPGTLAGLAIGGLLAGACGIGLFRWALPRWDRRYRAG